jgi:hypothetical protein
VWRIIFCLEKHRPDLGLIQVDCAPAGLLVVTELDASQRTLSDRYNDIIEEFVDADLEELPTDVLSRRRAVEPARLWHTIEDMRRRTQLSDGNSPAS